MPEFETYRRPSPDPADIADPVITVVGSEELRLNEAAIRALRTTHHVELLYDREAEIIGLRETDSKGTPDSFEVDYEYPNGNGARIDATEFLRHYGIAMDGAHHFRAHKDKNVLCMQLSRDEL